MVKVYFEFSNGESMVFRGITEEHAICGAVSYAVENCLDIEYYTELPDYATDDYESENEMEAY